jgi:very-short-patch-repair endonuclease
MINGPRDTIKKARKLRSEMSLPEVLLWRELRKRPGGFKFRRQHAAGTYVLDFYCAKAKLAIELDGWTHDNAAAVRRDLRRSDFLRSQGVATTRVPAKLVLDDMRAVIRRVMEICARRTENSMVPLHQPAAGPPPRSGEDL